MHHFIRLAATAGLIAASPISLADYDDHPKAAGLVNELVTKHGFSREYVMNVLEDADKIPRLIQAEKKSAEKVKPWYEYRKIFLTTKRINDGVSFMREHRQALNLAEQRYGVPPELITAIIGVETLYGNYTGKNRILDALATQGFDHPTRSPFFYNELLHLFLVGRKHNLDITELRGSYAGAMGVPQFMPSNYLRLAVDFDGNGRIDLWNKTDAIGSAANYFVNYLGGDRGWKRGEAVATPVQMTAAQIKGLPINQKQTDLTVAELERRGVDTSGLPMSAPDTPVGILELQGPNGPEYWVAFTNFYAIMSYNPRVKYAMAVYQLSQSIRRASAP
ncbi:MAG: lytic murein transglycosylase B [Nevskiales bacterium]